MELAASRRGRPENRAAVESGTNIRRGRLRTPAVRTLRCSAMPAKACGEPKCAGSSVTISPLLANGEARSDRLMPLVQKWPGSD